LFAG
jgi:hypothetical protein